MTLPYVLRVVAILVAGVALGEYLALGAFLPPPFIVAAILLALSFVYRVLPAATAWLTIILCVVVPVGAIMGYLQGDLPLLIPIFDAIVFAWLLWTAIRTLRTAGQVRPSA